MAATKVRSGTVRVVVTNVPKHFLVFVWHGTKTIRGTDLVGLKVADVVRRVEEVLHRPMLTPYTLNSRKLPWEERQNTVLQEDDRLELVAL